VAWVNHGENRITRATGWDGYGALYTTPPEAPVQDEFDIRGMLASKLTCWHRLREAEENQLVALVMGLAQPAPVQEPAWVDAAIRGDMARAVFDVIRIAAPGLGPWSAFDADSVQRMADALKPFTTPPAAQRQWFGLTPEDKHEPDMGPYVYLNDDWLDGYKTGMEYAEAKLKEKNT
jgi:hypothetical protein